MMLLRYVAYNILLIMKAGPSIAVTGLSNERSVGFVIETYCPNTSDMSEHQTLLCPLCPCGPGDRIGLLYPCGHGDKIGPGYPCVGPRIE